MSLDEVKDSILDIEGVLSLHELHVWQLSENKLVASVHVLASRNHDFMPVAVKIRKVLHHLGIHSCTIQPEYYHPGTSIPEERLKVFDLLLRRYTARQQLYVSPWVVPRASSFVQLMRRAIHRRMPVVVSVFVFPARNCLSKRYLTIYSTFINRSIASDLFPDRTTYSYRIVS